MTLPGGHDAQPTGLRGLLVTLVLLTLVPALGLALGNAVQERNTAAAAAQTEVVRFTRLFAESPEQSAKGARQLLAALALVPEIGKRDAKACGPILAGLLRDNPEYADILALTPGGEIFASATRNPAKAGETYGEVFQGRDSDQGFVWSGFRGGRAVLVFARSVPGPDGREAARLAAVVDLGTFAVDFELAHLPTGSSFAFVRRDGLLLLHKNEGGTLAGQSLPDAQRRLFLALAEAGDGASASGLGLDGVERIYSVKKLTLGRGADDLFVRAGIPRRTVFAAANGRLSLHLALIAVTALLVLLITRTYGNRFILNKVAALTDAAQRIRRGDLATRSGLSGSHGEFGILARAFDDMAEALSEREAERQRHLAEMREKEGRIQALFNASPDSVMLLDPQGVVLAANEVAGQRHHTDPRELVGTRLYDALPADTADLRRTKIAAVVDTGRAQVFDEELGERIYRIRLFPVVGPDGTVAQLASFSRDITQRRISERELLNAKRRAEVANEAKTQFLANMSHELRTPLNGILGMAQVLATTPLSEDQRGNLEMLRQSADNLHKIVNNLLELAHIEAGSAEILERAFPLDEVLQSLEKTFGTRIRLKGLDFEQNVGEDVPRRLLGDPFRLRQVLTNLLSNAVRFTPSGRIRLGVKRDSDQGGLKEHQVRLLFEVQDTGIGIPESAQEHIFQSFELAESYLDKRYGGSGLGLSIARQIVERLGGSIRVESQEGRGSTFSFTVVFGQTENQEAAMAMVPVLRAEDQGRGRRILLAEDEFTNRVFACQVLAGMNHSVTAVTNGAEAVEALEREPFDLVLMDVQMPILDGLSATRLIRGNPGRFKSPHVPIIALTAYAMESDRERFLAAGMNEFVTKPFTVEALTQAIRTALSGN